MAPYLTLMREDASQREYALRDVFDGLCWVVRTGGWWIALYADKRASVCGGTSAWPGLVEFQP